MDPEAFAKTVLSTVATFGAVVQVGGKRRRLRNEIRDNLVLMKELEQNGVLREHAASTQWLPDKIALDVAKLSGHPLGTAKKPIAWGSVFMAGIIGVPLGFWTYILDHEGFVWYSIFPGLGAFLMGISILGLTTNRELLANADGVA